VRGSGFGPDVGRGFVTNGGAGAMRDRAHPLRYTKASPPPACAFRAPGMPAVAAAAVAAAVLPAAVEGPAAAAEGCASAMSTGRAPTESVEPLTYGGAVLQALGSVVCALCVLLLVLYKCGRGEMGASATRAQTPTDPPAFGPTAHMADAAVPAVQCWACGVLVQVRAASRCARQQGGHPCPDAGSCTQRPGSRSGADGLAGPPCAALHPLPSQGAACGRQTPQHVSGAKLGWPAAAAVTAPHRTSASPPQPLPLCSSHRSAGMP
jgi:hypothetical protein